MASSQPRSPATPSAIPKRSFPSFSVRRPSTSAVNPPANVPYTSFSSTSTTTAVAASPTSLNHHNNSTQSGGPAGSGIPAFRSLRNFLPFGPPKNPANAPSTPSRSPFAGLGSMRRSITVNREKERDRERKGSLSNDTYTPVLSIERKLSRSQDEPPIRRSVSLSRLELNVDKPLPSPNPSSISLQQDESVVLHTLPLLRTPSPGPPLLAELSTIIEADSSGISKHVPLLTPSTESSHSLSPPTSPNHDDSEDHTTRRPVLHPPATPLMASSPLFPSTPAQPTSSSSSADADESGITDAELELSMSQLASQVKDAMARTSWTGNDKAFIFDGDTESNNDTDSAADANASLLAVVDVKLESSPGSPTSEIWNDDLSHVNNSTSSVVNPNELHDLADATMDLGSLDPDLRAAVSHSVSYNHTSFRKPTSPSSIGHSSASGKTVRLSSPPLRPPNHPHSIPRSVSASSVPSAAASTSSTSTSRSALAQATQAGSNSNIPQAKIRVASTFLPRLRSPTPQSHSAPVSAKNSPSPQKMNFDLGRGSGSTASPRSPAFFVGSSGSGGGTKGPGAPNGAHRVPSGFVRNATASASTPVLEGNTGNTPTLAEFGVGFGEKVGVGASSSGGGLMTSTPMKVRVRKGLVGNGFGGGHARKSSVPIATWRNSRGQFEQDDVAEREVEVVSKVGVGPEVRVVEASGEIDPNNIVNTTSSQGWKDGQRSDDTGRLSADRWSPRHIDRQLDNSPVLISNLHLHDDQESEGEDDRARFLGSPFHTPSDRGRLSVGPHTGDVHHPFRSRSHSPSPTPALRPGTLGTMTTPTTPILSSSTHNDNTYNDMATPNGIAHSPSPSPYLPPQSLVPSPTFPPSSANSGNTIFSRGGSRRGSTSGSAKETDGEASPTRVNDTGSLSGRPSRRIPAPLKLFWGSSGSGSSNGSGSGSTGEDRIVLPERQPSPLRSVVRVDAFGREGEDEEEREEIRRRLTPLMGSASTRPSLEESAATSTSVRPSFESGRPSMDSYAGSLSVSLRRSPEPGYIREGSVSRPPTRLRESDPETMRSRKRSMSVQGGLGGEFGVATNGSRGGSGSVVAGGSGNMSSAALSARERLARVRYGDLGGGTRPWSSLSMRSARTDNTSASLGVKSHGRSNRITAGSMEYDRERSPVLGGIERSISERTGEREMVQYRERSGSVSGVGTLGRYASLRTASEYNFTGNHSSVNLSMQHQTQHQPHPRAYSRMALSESSGGSGGHGRRGSGTFSSIGHGLMESPTLTVSTSASGSRDTPRSSSTGATSVSQVSAKEREREREELKELREKHAVETGALLNALSDSQRTCRMLREENGDLRERVAEVERENERLVRDLGELEREVERLRFSRERERVWERERLREREWDREREVGRGLSVSAGPGASGWRATATPLAKQRDVALGNRTMPRLNRWQGFERDPEHYDDLESTMKHTRSKLDNVLFPGEDELEPSFDDRHSLHEEDLVMQVEQKDEEDALSSTSTPAAPHRRRLSTSSSIFPIPPPNMTMLLHDETSMFPGTNRDSADVASLSGFKLSMSPVLPIPRVLKERHAMNNSVSSNISVSPPENFSMVTGSPGSLFLKPEHEMMLDEMESLDLGRSDKNEAEVWNE